MTPIAGTIEEPERGTWVADLEFTDPYEGTFDHGGVTWVGALASQRLEGGRHKVRIVGGNGRLGGTVGDRWYRGGASGNTIVQDIANRVGHAAAPNLPGRVASWARQRGTAGEALSALCDVIGAQWWVGRDGTLRVQTARPGGTVADLPQEDGDGEHVILVGDLVATVLPGAEYLGQVIRHVRHLIGGDKSRLEVSFRTTVPAGRGLDYLRAHRAVVESRHSDGTLDLIVGGRFSLTRIPWLPGIPGDCVLEAGDVVIVAAWGGDPRQWHAVGVSRVTGGTPVASVDDSVNGGTLVLAITPVGIPVALTHVAPGPTHDAELAALLLTITQAGNIPFPCPLTGLIDSGNPRILV